MWKSGRKIVRGRGAGSVLSNEASIWEWKVCIGMRRSANVFICVHRCIYSRVLMKGEIGNRRLDVKDILIV